MIDNKSFHSRVRITIIYIIVILLGLGCLFPLLNIVAISLSGSAAVSANKVGILPVDFTLIAYDKIVSDGQFWRSFMISVIRVFLALLLNLAVTVPMAYAMTKSKKEFRARNIYMNLLIFAMLFNGGMIPTYILVRNLGMLNSIWALVLPGALPIFNVILLMNFMRDLPAELEDFALQAPIGGQLARVEQREWRAALTVRPMGGRQDCCRAEAAEKTWQGSRPQA